MPEAESAALRVNRPTLLIGLGELGRRVLARVERGQEDAGGLVCLHADAARSVDDLVTEATEELRALLDLGRFVRMTSATDRRGPQCDVYVVADLGEPGEAERVHLLCTAAARRMREAFRSILRTGAGALVVCPILVVPEAADRASVRATLEALASEAASGDDGGGGRVHVVQDQSGKYVLSREELERTVAAFLHLVLFSQLRDDSLGVRSLVEAARGEAGRGGPFGSFACATLELDDRTVAELCSVKLAREVLALFRSGEDRGIDEVAALAEGLVPERGALEAALWKESATGSLAKHLEPPALHVPEIDASDSPERIVEQLFGPVWRANVARKIERFRDDIERFKMDRLAAAIEQNGKAALSSALSELARRAREQVASGPRGHAHTLEVLRDAHTYAKGRLDEVAAEIESPDLTAFPESPLDRRVAALEDAVFARPRDHRMAVFGVIGGFVGACLTAGVILGAYRGIVSPSPSFFDVTATPEGAVGRALATWPVAYVLGGATAGSSTYYRLFKHKKRHHNWVLEARSDLDQALKRHLHQEVVSYFQRRLHYTRLLWVQRIYSRLTLAIEELITRLEAVRAALAGADEELAATSERLEGRLRASAGGEGILFRGLLTPEEAHDVFVELRPRELLPIARRWLEESLTHGPWGTAPFAAAEPLRVFCEAAFRDDTSLRPFAHVAGAPASQLERIAQGALRDLLRQLALKLTPPIEIVEAFALEAPAVSHVVVVPKDAKELVESMLASEDLVAGWEVRALSSDARRVHLVVERGNLPLRALALVESP